MIKLWSWPDCCPSTEQTLVHFTAASSPHYKFSAPTALIQFVEVSGATLSAPLVTLVLVLLSSCRQVGCFCVHLAQLGTLWHFFPLAIWPWVKQRRQSHFVIINWVLSLIGFFTNSWHVSISWAVFPHQWHALFFPFFPHSTWLGSFSFAPVAREFASWFLQLPFLLLKLLFFVFSGWKACV